LTTPKLTAFGSIVIRGDTAPPLGARSRRLAVSREKAGDARGRVWEESKTVSSGPPFQCFAASGGGSFLGGFPYGSCTKTVLPITTEPLSFVSFGLATDPKAITKSGLLNRDTQGSTLAFSHDLDSCSSGFIRSCTHQMCTATLLHLKVALAPGTLRVSGTTEAGCASRLFRTQSSGATSHDLQRVRYVASSCPV
jgi:hypothetical protein